MEIIIDNRERISGIKKELIKKGIDVIEKQLISADFVIQTKNSDGKEILLGIEKKTQTDFINSIIDKRILKQLIELKENFDIPLLIIEGSENIYRLRNFNPNAIRGMLASIAIDFQVPILHTKNVRDTASLLDIIARRLERPVRSIGLLGKRKPLSLKERQEFLIESLPGIGPSLSKSLLKEFGSVKAILNAKKEDLQKVEKIGPKKADKIKEVIEKDYT